ncbi:MAG: outer membrane protein assembly factor BamC [Azoarcus sp.]|jgi:outer membrane protein assembly factor BamC|nr:outer membrane protein assembly factor BamC [Azoarcus sp.]
MNRSFSPPFRISVSTFAAALALAACSSDSGMLQPRRVDYKRAKPSSTLEIPPDLTAPRGDDRYTVPDVSPRSTATYSGYTADRAAQSANGTPGVLAKADSMRIERAGTQRWLVVRGTPETLWPQLRDFWLELGFVLNIDNAEIGVLETDWRENRANIQEGGLRKLLGKVIDGLYSTPERDKFRTRIEQGAESGTVEIYISHRGMMEIYPNEAKDATVWQPRPADPELEVEILRRLMVRLGADEAHAQTVAANAAAAAASAQAARAQVRAVDGENRLRLDEPFDRAWRRVGLALDRVNFTVEDSDRSKGLYYVRYIDPDVDNNSSSKGGFFSKLAFWRSGDDEKAKGSEHRLRIEDRGDWSSIVVLDGEEGMDRSPTAQRILDLLQKELR